MKTRPPHVRALMLLLVAFLLSLVAGCGGMSMDMAPSQAAERSGGADDGYGVQLASEDMPRPEMDAQYAANTPGEAPMEPPPPPPAPAPAPAQPSTVDAPGPPDVVKKQASPLLIYTADYTMAVFEATSAIDAVQKEAEELGGYLVRRTDRSIVVRVPSNSFKKALATLDGLGDVIHREETVEDVTEAFYDLKTRLANARALRSRLEQLLAEAKNVEEALGVEKELARVTGEIEVMEGKLKRLRELIAFSTITVRFEPRSGEAVNDDVRLPFPWLDQLGLSNLLNL